MLGRKLALAMQALAVGTMVVASFACTSNSARKQYLLAEKLWTDAKYAAAINEFDKVAAKDPRGKLGLQALYRSASTQMLFLSQFDEAARKFRRYAETPGADPK